MDSVFAISTVLFCSCLLSRVFIYVSSKHPDLLTGIKGCSNDSICIENHNFSYCNEINQCECEFGYFFRFNESENRSNCIEFKCTDEESSCSKYWGPSSVCDVTLKYKSYRNKLNQCTCPYALYYSQAVGKCILPKIGEKCDIKNSTYYPWAAGASEIPVCSKGKWKCFLGDTPTSNHSSCKRYYCKTDEQCQKFFPHSACHSTTQECFCADGYSIHNDLTECSRRLRQDDCQFAQNCGKTLVCQQGKCACPQGHIASPRNLWECERINCTANNQCTEQDENSYCDISSGHCKCPYATSKDGSQCSMAPVELKPLPVKKQEAPEILYVVIYIGAGSIVILVAAFMIYQFYPQIERLTFQLSEKI